MVKCCSQSGGRSSLVVCVCLSGEGTAGHTDLAKLNVFVIKSIKAALKLINYCTRAEQPEIQEGQL